MRRNSYTGTKTLSLYLSWHSSCSYSCRLMLHSLSFHWCFKPRLYFSSLRTLKFSFMQCLCPCKMRHHMHIPLRSTEPYVEPGSYTYSLIYVFPSYPVGTGSSLPLGKGVRVWISIWPLITVYSRGRAWVKLVPRLPPHSFMVYIGTSPNLN